MRFQAEWFQGLEGLCLCLTGAQSYRGWNAEEVSYEVPSILVQKVCADDSAYYTAHSDFWSFDSYKYRFAPLYL